ncbi:MAG: hypothetical protein ACPKM0_00550 [Pleomorphochaeta sp.]
MKKRILTIVALMVLVVAPTFAKSSDMSAGLALGTINGVGFKYNVDRDLTVGGTLGFDIIGDKTLNAEGFAVYNVSEFSIEKEDFDVNAGGGLSFNIPLSGGAFSISALAMGEVSYSFEGDLPIDVLFRVEPGLALAFTGSSVDPSFVIQASLQGLYRFDM